MSSTVTASHTDIFDEILSLDLSKCSVTVYMASVAKDEAPRFARVPIDEDLAEGFRDTVKNLVNQYKDDDCRQLSLFPEYVEESVPEAYEIEHLDLSKYQDILGQLTPLKSQTDIDVFDRDERFVKGLRFYVISVQPLSGEAIYFFRSYTHKKMLERSFIYAIFKQNAYNRATEPVLIFDSQIDCMCRGDVMFIFEQKEFQNIFQFFDEIREIAKEALESIKVSIPIKNFDEFSNDCGKHIWKQRKLKKIASKPYLSRITMAHLKKVINKNKLHIRIEDVNGREMLVYDKRDKWTILKLLDDDYLWSMLTEQNYEVTGKRELP